MPSVVQPALFTPTQLGNITLQHRVAMAPLTRKRADNEHAHTDLGVEYYAQRASTPGTLLITEATLIDPAAGGYDNVPGIWNDKQVSAWKKIVDAVHARGSHIFLQLWALGRAGIPEVLARDGGYSYVSSGDIPLPGDPRPAPRPLTVDEIQSYVGWYARAASLAVHGAGFDGVEIHSANGYLLDQFLQDVSNNRTDNYGGSIENRARFPLQVVDAVVSAVGASRTAIRFSPFETFQGMRMADPVPTFAYVLEQLRERHGDLAYVHLTEPRIAGTLHRDDVPDRDAKGATLGFAHRIWAPRPMILAGGYTREEAIKRVDEGARNGENLVIAFGRHFIANPDLPLRLRDDLPLNKYHRPTFYTQGAEGYTDYPFVETTLA